MPSLSVSFSLMLHGSLVSPASVLSGIPSPSLSRSSKLPRLSESISTVPSMKSGMPSPSVSVGLTVM